MKHALALLVALVVCTNLTGCGNNPRDDAQQVVVYTSVDRVFAEPVLREAGQVLGLRVVGVYDTEETKSTGLVNRLLARKDNPDGDIFWSGDAGRAALLKLEGVTDVYRSPAASGIPPVFVDPDGHWTGFSARARVLLVNTDLVPEGQEPKRLSDLVNPAWKGRVAFANPLFGTTSYHVAALFDAWGDEQAWKWLHELKLNDVQIVSSNGEVKRRVASGQAAVGLTDTDDAAEAIKDGQPVRMVFLDQVPLSEGDPALGTLVIPNTLSLIRNGPNPEGAKLVLDYLLSPEVQVMLAKSCAQAPLSPDAPVTPDAFPVATVRPMQTDYARVAQRLDALMGDLKRWVENP